MSRDSREDEKSRSQRTKHEPRRRRTRGQPSWYAKAANENYQEEVMQIPRDKAGLVIGKKGWRVKDIMEQSGVKKLSIKEDLVHLIGTEEQRASAKKFIDMILRVSIKFVLVELFCSSY